MPERKNISGIVVCGGQSSRMGKDKSALDYHGKPQWQYMQELLSGFCSKVYLSVNELQAKHLTFHLPLLEDLPAFREKGPMAALLTAFDILPGQDILLAGCDYPFLQEEELGAFLSFVSEAPTAAAFYNERENLYEPLLAFYPQELAGQARNLAGTGNYSLQSLLRQSDARKYYPLDIRSIESVDTPEQYRAALKITDPEAGFKKED